MSSGTEHGVDKRRVILDAAVCVFARQGFHSCRVSDIADEAGVAYGLVYHYFSSKEAILDTLFTERWQLLLDLISTTDEQDLPAREKLTRVVDFIIESYRHSPELMKVIIVEVTRAANSFGLTHAAEIEAAYLKLEEVIKKGSADGSLRRDLDPEFAALVFYGAIEQVLTGWIFGLIDENADAYERAKIRIVQTICDGLEP